MFEYTGIGLNGIYLKNGYTIFETSHGKGVKIRNVEQLHRAIAIDIVRQKTPMTGHQFRFLRKEQGLSREKAAALFRVGRHTIANWEKKGSGSVSGASDIAMRVWYCAHIRTHYRAVKVPASIPPDEGATFQHHGNHWIEAHAVQA